jgi:putative nucleotidyltransferase with HDIG domain
MIVRGGNERLRSYAANAYIWAYLLIGAAALCWTAANWQLHDRRQFFAYLITAVVASSLKVQLPGLKGTASVGFLFVFIGILDLSTEDAIVITAVAMAVQCTWRARDPLRPIQVCWSVASISASVYAASTVYGWTRGLGEPVALAALAGTFFAASTGSLAGVIALTQGTSFRRTVQHQGWLLPYYLCGTSVAWIIGTMPRAIQWEVPIICLPVIYIIHRSYAKHLRQVEQEKEHVEEINSLHLRTIETLAVAIEARDQETHDHLQRVQIYALEIGRDIGLSEVELNALRAASLLHDIGKLAVPEQIISKPGKLTPAEFERMKIHPVVGAEILERVRFPYQVVPIVRAHHEKWDGSGYPDGLEGEQIPIGARILAAVDCLDALASDRHYRRALPLDQAMAMIAAGAGTSFDPQVVSILQRRYRELEALAQAGRPAKGPGLSTDLRVARGASPAAGFARFAERVRASTLQQEQCYGFAALAVQLQTAVPYDAMAFFSDHDSSLHPEFVAGAYGGAVQDSLASPGEGLIGWVAANRTPIINGNPGVERGCAGAARGLRSALALPVSAADGTPGVLSLYRCAPESFDEDDLSAVSAVAERAGIMASCPGPLLLKPGLSARAYEKANQDAA